MTLIRKRMVTSLALVAILLATMTSPVWAQVPLTRMRNVAIQVLSVTAGLTADDITTTDDVVVGDDLTVVGDAAMTGDTTLAGDLTLTAASVITVTNGATLSPTGSFQPIAAAGAVGFGAITAGSTGQLLIIENTVNQTITITDSATLRLGGNAALGQYDTLMLIYDGATWVQTSKTDN